MKKNKIIAEFMGYKESKDVPGVWTNKKGMGGALVSGAFDYHKDWNLLMEACKKWDRLGEVRSIGKSIEASPSIAYNQDYIIRCDVLDNAVSCYDIKKTFKQLVENIEWYNQTSFKKN